MDQIERYDLINSVTEDGPVHQPPDTSPHRYAHSPVHALTHTCTGHTLENAKANCSLLLILGLYFNQLIIFATFSTWGPSGDCKFKNSYITLNPHLEYFKYTMLNSSYNECICSFSGSNSLLEESNGVCNYFLLIPCLKNFNIKSFFLLSCLLLGTLFWMISVIG